jgi:hypothetical protein
MKSRTRPIRPRPLAGALIGVDLERSERSSR